MSTTGKLFEKVIEEISDGLVNEYLVRNEYFEVAKALKNAKQLKEFDLKGLQIEDIIRNQNENPFRNSVKRKSDYKITTLRSKLQKFSENETFCCAIIADHWYNHGLAYLAKELEEATNCQNVDLKGVTLIKIYQSQKSKNAKNDELNHLVPIKTIFQDKIQLKVDPKDSEMFKVVNFILNSNIKVKKSIQITLNYTLRSSAYRFSSIESGHLSSLRYGESSEESMILKQWEILVDQIPIISPQKFLIDLEMTDQKWIQSLIGAYLSQPLSLHRCADQLYKALINLKKRKGAFTEEEQEELLEFYDNHHKNPSVQDWKKLALKMGRRKEAIQGKLNYLLYSENKAPKRKEFNLSEDKLIIEFVNENFDINNPSELKAIRPKSLYPLAKQMERGQENISKRWIYKLLPIILTQLYCATDIPWKEEVVKYVIESQFKTLNEINWSFVLERWPFLTKAILTDTLNKILNETKLKNLPLFEQLKAYKSSVRQTRKVKKDIEERRNAIIDIFDVMQKEKIKKNKL